MVPSREKCIVTATLDNDVRQGKERTVFWGNKAAYNFVLLQELVLREKL